MLNLSIYDWKQGHSIGFEKIDCQHKLIFELAGNLIHQMPLLTDRGEENPNVDINVIKKISELIDVLECHFEDEETLMRAIGFDQIKLHIEMHLDCIAYLRKIKSEGKLTKIQSIELIRFICGWLCQHIRIEDVKILHYVVRSSQPVII